MAPGQQHFFRRFTDFGTGRLPANVTLDGGRYLLLQTLGQGGMGAVYLAYDTQQSNQLVAIKEMGQSKWKDPVELQKAQQRFQQEADMLRHLRHPHLPQVYASFQDRNRSYLVMDYIKGKTLAQELKQAKGAALPVEQVVNYGLQLCEVLAYLHKHYPPVIFRDLKPSNIIVQDDGQLFLIDFGIARFWQHTTDTAVFVTPGYTAPEQYGGQSEPRSDIFSLGATLHHCLTGHNPQSNTQGHGFDFEPVDFYNSQALPDLCTLIEQMVAIKPEDRPASVDEVQRQFQKMRLTLVGAVRLPSEETYNPGAPTYQMGTITKTAAAQRRPRPRLRLPLMGLGAVASGLFGGMAGALHSAGAMGVGKALRTLPAQWWKNVGRAVDNWSWDPRVWTPRFVGVLLAALLLVLGGSLYLVKTAPDAAHLTGLALIFGLLCLLATNLSDERLTDPVLRSLFGLMGLGLLLAGLSLQALPDMVNLEQQYLPLLTLNKVWSLLLVLGAVVCLLRPHKRFAWVDQLQLGFLAGTCALLHYGFGSAEVAQLPYLTPANAQTVLPLLVWSLLGLALLAVFRSPRPFGGWSRFTLLLVALAFAPLQYVFGYNELQHFLAAGSPSDDLLQRLAQANVFFVFVPLVCALLAVFTRPPATTPPEERHPGVLIRLAQFLLTLVVAALFSQLGQGIELPFFPNNAFPLSISVLTIATLYQLVEPLLVLLTFIALLRLRRPAPFSWLDHGVTVGLAAICALFDSAYWQAQASSHFITTDQHAANQQFLLLAGQVPADVIYGLLIALPVGLFALAICHFRRQSHPSMRLDARLKGLRALLIVLERVLILALLALALILQGFFGSFIQVAQRWSQTQQFTGSATNVLAVLAIGVLGLLCVLGCVVFVRLLAPSQPAMGGIERWVVWLAALACLLLTWQNLQPGNLPLLLTGVQLSGNLLHWPEALLSLVLVGGLVLSAALARLWLRRGFFTRYRALMQPAFLLALFCFLLQLIWPIFLPLGLILFIVGVLLASQIEKVV